MNRTTDAIRRTFHPSAYAALIVRRVSPAELSSRATGAANLAMRGKGYDIEDRRDCAAEITGRVLAEADRLPHGHGPARSVLAYIAAAERKPWRSAVVEYVPADRATFTRLYGLARNFRKALDTRRKYQQAADNERSALVGFVSAAVGDTPRPAETVGTPDGARRCALDMLRNLGLAGSGHLPRKRSEYRAEPMGWAGHGKPADVLSYLADMERTRDGNAWPVAWGMTLRSRPIVRADARADFPDPCLWTLAYAAARSSAGLESAAIADELGMSAKTLHNHLSAARRALPSVSVRTPSAHAEALGVPAGGVAYGPGACRLERADRVSLDPSPVAVRTDPTIVRDRSAGLSDWAQALATGTPAERRTAARLAQAAAIRDGSAEG